VLSYKGIVGHTRRASFVERREDMLRLRLLPDRDVGRNARVETAKREVNAASFIVIKL